tara:strand:- start:85 stop:582 length:498 start_codon:yes stop_codon:yes gene_type:complete
MVLNIKKKVKQKIFNYKIQILFNKISKFLNKIKVLLIILVGTIAMNMFLERSFIETFNMYVDDYGVVKNSSAINNIEVTNKADYSVSWAGWEPGKKDDTQKPEIAGSYEQTTNHVKPLNEYTEVKGQQLSNKKSDCYLWPLREDVCVIDNKLEGCSGCDKKEKKK